MFSHPRSSTSFVATLRVEVSFHSVVCQSSSHVTSSSLLLLSAHDYLHKRFSSQSNWRGTHVTVNMLVRWLDCFCMRLHLLNTPVGTWPRLSMSWNVLHKTLFCNLALPRLSSMVSPLTQHYQRLSVMTFSVTPSTRTQLTGPILHVSLTYELCHSLTIRSFFFETNVTSSYLCSRRRAVTSPHLCFVVVIYFPASTVMDHILSLSFLHSAVLSYAAYVSALCFSLTIASRLKTLSQPWHLAPVTLIYAHDCPGFQTRIERYHGSSVLDVVFFRLNATLSSHLNSCPHLNAFRRTPPAASCRGCLHDFGRNCVTWPWFFPCISARHNRVKMQVCNGIQRRGCFFWILWNYTIHRTGVLTANDPTRHHWRYRREVTIWRSTILLFRINEETDSGERERSRLDTRKERGYPAWRRQVKEMTTEEMNESSWSTYEKLINQGQNYDDIVIITYKVNDKRTQRVWDDTD